LIGLINYKSKSGCNEKTNKKVDAKKSVAKSSAKPKSMPVQVASTSWTSQGVLDTK